MKQSKILLGILSLTVALAAQGQAPTFLTNGLVAYYPMNGNANDATGNGNNLVNYGATLTTDRFGNLNQAYSFSGGSYLGTGNAPMLQIGDSTITAWMQLASLNQGPGFVVCLGQNAGVNDGYGFGVSGGNQLYAMYPGIVFEPAGYAFSSTIQWYQVVMATSGGEGMLYVDGVPTGSSFPISVSPPTSFEIGSGGSAPYSGNIYFVGSIDDVRVYNRALSLSEIQELYQFDLSANASPQAVAAAVVTNGFVVGATITYGGFGYTSTPTVTITGGGGSGAQAVAVVSNQMVVAIDILDAGSDYTNAPTVLIESPVDFHPFPATATADVTNGFVVGANITFGGYGYTNTPAVRIIGGGGSGAQAVAVVNFGVVEAINFLDAGYGYTNTPVLVIAPPFIPQPTLVIAASTLLSFPNLEVGTNYQFQYLTDNIWANIGLPFTATNSIFTQYVAGAISPNLYRMATTPVPLQAYATAEVFDGFVVGAVVTNGGSGYTASPAVTISAPSGSGATAVATVSGGAVTGITIIDAGEGYTNVTISIAPPPANALAPNVTPALGLNIGDLSPYDNYQLQFSPDLSGTWSNLGAPFSTTSTSSAFYFNSSGAAGFYRLEYLP